MEKVKITIESKTNGKEEFTADGIIYTLLQSDEQNRMGLMTSYRGPIKEAAIFGNALATTRNFVMTLLGVKTAEEEEKFDAKVRQTSEIIRKEFIESRQKNKR